MDEDTKAAFEGVNAKLDAMMERMNVKFDDVLDKMTALRNDMDTVRGHLIYGLQEDLTLSQRVTKLEEQMRGLRP